MLLAAAQVGTNGGRILSIDPVSYAVTSRLDVPWRTSSLTRLKASFDRSVIGVAVGDSSNGPVYQYFSATNAFSAMRPMQDFIAAIAFDRTGTTALVASGAIVLDSELNITGKISGIGFGAAVDPVGAIGYQATKSGIDVLDLVRFTKISTLSPGDTLAQINGFTAIGQMALSQDGKLLGVITDNGFALVNSSYAGTSKPDNGSSTPLPEEGGIPGVCSTDAIQSPLVIKSEGVLSDVLIDDDCKYIYAANRKLNRVEIYSAKTGAFRTSIQVGSQPLSIDTSPDGKLLYTANAGGSNISIVDLAARKERKVSIPATMFENLSPYSLAVDNRGRVLLSARWYSSAYILQYRPLSNTFEKRLDYDAIYESAFTAAITNLKASPDRTVIGISPGGLSPGSLHKYTAATDSFSPKVRVFTSQVTGSNYIAFDQTGRIALTGPEYRDSAAYVIDGNLNILGTVPDPTRTTYGEIAFGIAVSPSGAVGYQVRDSSIDVIDMTRYVKIGDLPLGETVRGGDSATAPGRIAISRDGNLLAVTTKSGFAMVRGGVFAMPPLRILARSTSTSNQSYLRFYNSGKTAGTVGITLTDPTSGKMLAQWTSPSIAPGAAPQYAISTIEAAAKQAFTKPEYYVALVQTTMPGTFSEVIFNATTETLTNVSTCSLGNLPASARVSNVHNSMFDTGYPSAVILVNTGPQNAPARLGIYDAGSGTKLGTYTSAPVTAGGGATISSSTIEHDAGIKASANALHYVIKIENEFSGYLQQVIVNRRPGIVVDMTLSCALLTP